MFHNNKYVKLIIKTYVLENMEINCILQVILAEVFIFILLFRNVLYYVTYYLHILNSNITDSDTSYHIDITLHKSARAVTVVSHLED